MAQTELDSARDLQRSLEQVTEDMGKLFSQTKGFVEESLDGFVQSKVSTLSPAIGYYYKCFQRAGVVSRDEMERKVRKHYRNEEIRDSFEELLDVEREWNSFLKEVDRKSERTTTEQLGRLEEGDSLPEDLSLRSIETDSDISLKQLLGQKSIVLDTINGLNSTVIVVSFASKKRSLEWKTTTNCSYDILLDPGRKVYKAVGLHPSIAKVWHTDMLNYYGGKKAAGEILPPPDKSEDTTQMGGNLIVDKHGKLILVYRSKTGADRPDMSTLLAKLKKLTELEPPQIP